MLKLKKQILLKSVRTVSFHQFAKISHGFHCIQLNNLQQGVKMPGEIWHAFVTFSGNRTRSENKIFYPISTTSTTVKM